MRDQFVVGLWREVIQQKLLTEKELTYAVAVEKALAMEMAAKDTKELAGHTTAAAKVQYATTTTASKVFSGRGTKPKHATTGQEYCVHCGDSNHRADRCLHRDTECSYCHKRGHLKCVCLKATVDSGFRPASRANSTTEHGVQSCKGTWVPFPRKMVHLVDS